MKIQIEIETSNDAFEGRVAAEFARILVEIIRGQAFARLPYSQLLRDINGNTVGKMLVTDDEGNEV